MLAISACGSSGPTAASTTGVAPASTAGAVSLPTAEGQPIGAGCSAVPSSGAGSFADMAALPLVTAARHNPALSTLVGAVTRANLVDSLDAQQGITVLAPADPAFAAIPKKTPVGCWPTRARLTQVLTHHVIQGRLTPAQLAGTHITLNNDTVTIERSGPPSPSPPRGPSSARSPPA